MIRDTVITDANVPAGRHSALVHLHFAQSSSIPGCAHARVLAKAGQAGAPVFARDGSTRVHRLLASPSLKLR